MLCNTFLLLFVLLIHLGPSSLNESWHIYKIILTGLVFLVLAPSYLAIDSKFFW